MLAKRFPQLIKDSLAESEAKGLIKGEANPTKIPPPPDKMPPAVAHAANGRRWEYV